MSGRHLSASFQIPRSLRIVFSKSKRSYWLPSRSEAAMLPCQEAKVNEKSHALGFST